MPLSMRRRVQELVRKAAEKAGVTIERIVADDAGPATLSLSPAPVVVVLPGYRRTATLESVATDSPPLASSR